MNIEQARKWHRIAALLGHQDAQIRLNFLPREEIPRMKSLPPVADTSVPGMQMGIVIMLLPVLLWLLMLALRYRRQRSVDAGLD